MAKKVGLKIGVSLAVLVGGVFLVRYFFRRAVAKAIKASLLASGELNLQQDSAAIQVTNTETGEIFSTFEFTGNDMAFPLSHDPSMVYDNVAKLQAFLLFANSDLDMPIDGRFGDMTSEAVLNETEGLTDYGYDAEDFDYETITQVYYNDVVVPELQYFIENQ